MRLKIANVPSGDPRGEQRLGIFNSDTGEEVHGVSSMTLVCNRDTMFAPVVALEIDVDIDVNFDPKGRKQ